MSQPVARQGDLITTTCEHQVQGKPPDPAAPPVVAPVSHPFNAMFDQQLSQKVKIDGKLVVLKGSTGLAKVHLPLPPPGTVAIGFVKPPNNQAEVFQGSKTVRIEGKPVARIGDPVKTCSELPPPHGVIAPAPGKPTQVFIGG
jgi:uncharacterized Zn-binding protein involved in type VI secretion